MKTKEENPIDTVSITHKDLFVNQMFYQREKRDERAAEARGRQ